jgi:hypothetical protein
MQIHKLLFLMIIISIGAPAFAYEFKWSCSNTIHDRKNSISQKQCIQNAVDVFKKTSCTLINAKCPTTGEGGEWSCNADFTNQGCVMADVIIDKSGKPVQKCPQNGVKWAVKLIRLPYGFDFSDIKDLKKFTTDNKICINPGVAPVATGDQEARSAK